MPDPSPFELIECFHPGTPPPGRVVLTTTTLRAGKEHNCWCYNLREFDRRCQKYRNTRQLRFAAALHDAATALEIARGLRAGATPRSIRGCEASVTALPALWVEIPYLAAARPPAAPAPGHVHALPYPRPAPGSGPAGGGGPAGLDRDHGRRRRPRFLAAGAALGVRPRRPGGRLVPGQARGQSTAPPLAVGGRPVGRRARPALRRPSRRRLRSRGHFSPPRLGDRSASRRSTSHPRDLPSGLGRGPLRPVRLRIPGRAPGGRDPAVAGRTRATEPPWRGDPDLRAAACRARLPLARAYPHRPGDAA